TAHTAQRRFSGCTGADPVLSEVGERQAALLAAALRRRGGVDVVLSSPVRRARQTAAALAAALDRPVGVEDDLREVDFGAWEARTVAQVHRDWPGELAAWRQRPGYPPPGGESVEQVAARVARVRERVAGRHPGATVLLVSHLYPVRLSVLDALRVPYEAVHRMALEPTSVSEIRLGADAGTTLVRYNDTCHLSDAPP
ncbi:MAG TPA: histidine phosphatase family protein, partial [Catenuloplanes sp.]